MYHMVIHITIEGLRKIVSAVLKYIKHLIILKNYKNCIEKIDRYKKRVKYRSL